MRVIDWLCHGRRIYLTAVALAVALVWWVHWLAVAPDTPPWLT